MSNLTQDVSERPDPIRRRSISFYLVLLFIVAPLWSSLLFSWGFVIYSLNTGIIWSFSWLGRFLFIAALVEVYFSIYYYHVKQKVSGPTPHGPGNIADIQAAFSRVLKTGLAHLPEDGFDEESLDLDRPGSPAEAIIQLERDDPRAVDFRNVLRNWFGRVPWSSVHQHEMFLWLYWSIFNCHLPALDKLPRGHRAVLDDALDLVQKRAGCIVPPGRSPSHVRPIRLTLDQVNISWRPFWWYALLGAFNWLAQMCLEHKWNISHGTFDGVDYLLRIPETWDPVEGARPIVFLHGLGAGVLGYSIFIDQLLCAFPDRPFLMPLQPHVSQNIFHRRFVKPMTRHETADRLASLIEKLGWAAKRQVDEVSEGERNAETFNSKRKGVTMLSHSNGSYTHAWMLKGYPEMVTRSCFVDPVTFCSWEGDVCYNIIYRSCQTGIELLMRYFIVNELGVANHFQRHFDWTSNALWYEEIPNARDPSKTLFVLGGKDSIVNAERVQKYLRSHGIRKGLWVDPNGRHGEALIMGGPGYNQLITWLRD